MKRFLLPAIFLCNVSIFSQVSSTSAQRVLEALGEKMKMEEESSVKNIRFKNIGPDIMSGRVADIEVNPANTIEFYVGYASGGLWYTQNNGTSFIPVLDSSQSQNVGDLAVDWKTGTIWVGTGENNSSRSSYAGIGILKSTDRGNSWENMGLTDSHHIGRIIINPENAEEVVVGVLGHLYSPNEERGIYKTLDGGKTWQKTLFINPEAGIIDLVQVPGKFNTMYAAAWERERTAWDFTGNGKGSGIYKSSDAGNNWHKVSNANSGFPTGDGVGRIGLAAFDENTIYAVLDNQYRREKVPKKTPGDLTKADFKSMSLDDFLKLRDKALNDYLSSNGFPDKYKAEHVKELARNGIIKPADLAKYLEDANSLLFDTPVIGAEVYRSDDGGLHWKKTHDHYIDDLYYSYGYYFGEIRVDPANRDKIYLGGVAIIKSEDGGKTYTSVETENVHADHQAFWVDTSMPGHLIIGNDGGINMTYDDGDHWTKHNSTPVGQFYAINVDHREPYHVYGGLQDNGVWMGPHNGVQNSRWHQTGHHPWKSILGGDGMQVQIDSRDPNVVYTGYQFGNYFRLHLGNEEQKNIQPKHGLGENPFRFNWQTPILLSPHNQDILYLGSNKLHRSFNRGDTWEIISDDLTKRGRQGNVPYGTLTTISESPLKFGLLYAGSDDGLIHLSQNGGANWELISGALPGDLWVSRVAASKHRKERVYISLNGYRRDDFTPYVYMSNNYGASWKNIAGNIPASPVNVVLEDPDNESLLYAGTDNGLYVSFDQGDRWELFQSGIPDVAIHDLVIQPEASHLLVGTHGRSIYRADISYLQKMTPELMSKGLHVFQTDTLKYNDQWGNPDDTWDIPDTPGLDIVFYAGKAATFAAEVRTLDGTTLSGTTLDADKGLNVMSYDVAFSKAGKAAYLKKNKKELREAKNGKTYLPKGKYVIEISGDGNTEKAEFEIE